MSSEAKPSGQKQQKRTIPSRRPRSLWLKLCRAKVRRGSRLPRQTMNSLLKLATDAHGGLERWNKLTSLTARLSVTGAIWQIKGKPDVLKNIQIDLTLHVERVITHLIGQDKRFFFTPSRVATENEQGKTLDARN